MNRIKATLGGVAVVCCVHDREKRQVTTQDHVERLGYELGRVYDPKVHYTILCACCENLFVSTSDAPRFCHVCNGSPVHQVMAPLPEPNEGSR